MPPFSFIEYKYKKTNAKTTFWDGRQTFYLLTSPADAQVLFFCLIFANVTFSTVLNAVIFCLKDTSWWDLCVKSYSICIHVLQRILTCLA